MATLSEIVTALPELSGNLDKGWEPAKSIYLRYQGEVDAFIKTAAMNALMINDQKMLFEICKRYGVFFGRVIYDAPTGFSYFKKAAELAEKIYGSPSLELVQALDGVGNCVVDGGDNLGAIDYYLEALTDVFKLPESPETARYQYKLRNDLLNCYAGMGTLTYNEKAAEHYKHGLVENEKFKDKGSISVSEYHRRVAILNINMAIGYCNLKDVEEVKKCIQEIEVTFKNIREIDPEFYNKSVELTGLSYHLSGIKGELALINENYKEALALFQNAYKIAFDQNKDANSPQLAEIYRSIGDAYFGLEDFENARINYTKALQMTEELHKSHPKGHPDLATSIQRMAYFDFKNGGSRRDARDDLERALAMFENTLAPGHVNTEYTRVLLKEVEQALKARAGVGV